MTPRPLIAQGWHRMTPEGQLEHVLHLQQRAETAERALAEATVVIDEKGRMIAELRAQLALARCGLRSLVDSVTESTERARDRLRPSAPVPACRKCCVWPGHEPLACPEYQGPKCQLFL